MDIYNFTYPYVLTAFGIGICMSALIYEKYGRLSGGAIVPSIFALFMDLPFYIITTLLLVVLTNEVINLMKSRMILYGRRLYSTVLLTGIFMALMSKLIMSIAHYFGYGIYIGFNDPTLILPYISINIPIWIMDMGMGTNYIGYCIGILIVPIITSDVQLQGYKNVFTVLCGIAIFTFILLKLIFGI